MDLGSPLNVSATVRKWANQSHTEGTETVSSFLQRTASFVFKCLYSCTNLAQWIRNIDETHFNYTNLENEISVYYHLCLIFTLGVWHSCTWCLCNKIGRSNQPSRIWILQKNALTIFNSFKCQYHKSVPVQLQQKFYNNALNIKQLCQLQLN